MSPRMKSMLKKWDKYLKAQPERRLPKRRAHGKQTKHPVFHGDPVEARAAYSVDRVNGRKQVMTRSGKTLQEALGAYEHYL